LKERENADAFTLTGGVQIRNGKTALARAYSFFVSAAGDSSAVTFSVCGGSATFPVEVTGVSWNGP